MVMIILLTVCYLFIGVVTAKSLGKQLKEEKFGTPSGWDCVGVSLAGLFWPVPFLIGILYLFGRWATK